MDSRKEFFDLFNKVLELKTDVNFELPKLRCEYKWVLNKCVDVIREETNEIIHSFMWTKFQDKNGLQIKYFDEVKKGLEEMNYFESTKS